MTVKLHGGSLTVREIKSFLESSYMQPAPDEVMGYKLDNQLSNLYGKVYYNESLKKVVVAHRGTSEVLDWTNNAWYAALPGTVAYKMTDRYKSGYRLQEAAHKKYKGWQFETIGHSQAGLLAHLLGTKSKNTIMLNPAYKNERLGSNEYIIRFSGDLVSQLSVGQKFKNSLLYPSWSKNHYIKIENKTGNPLTEHAITILDRLPEDKRIGRGAGRPKLSKPCKCDKKKQLNGYSLNVCLSKV
jgi:hypothetical protein